MKIISVNLFTFSYVKDHTEQPITSNQVPGSYNSHQGADAINKPGAVTF